MTKLEYGKEYHGFILEKRENLDDIHATGYLFFHKKSGARLCYLAAKDNNKVFSVAFRTPPENDCGTPHILEHSVLCGSEKYGSKDPFNELAKGSLNTFLNAMTYADKTLYPIASCNEKDFHNMMDVYLDAVFHPNIYKKKAIFLQEGWRYEKTETGRQVTGVVFNEMKGALSDPESRLGGVIAQSIFGKTTYGFESGGNPSAIPELTYEDFLNFHRKYYHPSNSYFYLYGDMDVLPCLQHINGEYLCHYTQSADLPSITETTVPNPGCVIKATYPAAEGEKELHKGYFAYNFKVGKCTNPKDILTMQILGYLLLETNASPLKNRLRDANVCEEAEGFFDSSTYEMVYSIIAKKAEAEKFEDFCKIVEDTLSELAKTGFDADLLEGSLKKMEFLLREEDYGSRPKGLVYHTQQMKSWLHGEDPFACLHQLKIFLKLKEEIQAGYLQVFIKEQLLGHHEKTKILFLPEEGKQKKEDDIFREKIDARFAQMTSADLEILDADAEELAIFQNTPDSPAILAQIPLLQREDIHKNVRKVPWEEKNCGRQPYLYVPMDTQGLLYIQLLFPASLPWEYIPYTGLITEVLGKLDTKYTDFTALSSKIDRTFGGFACSNDIYSKSGQEYAAFAAINFKILAADMKNAFSFVKEIITASDYTMVESLKKIIKSARLKGEMYFQNYAHQAAISRSRGAISVGAAIKEKTTGIDYYRFLGEIAEKLEKNPEEVISMLQKTAKLLFTSHNLRVAMGCDRELLSDFENEFAVFVNCLSKEEVPQEKLTLPLKSRKEGFSLASGVQYNVQSWDLAKLGAAYSGKLQVLRTVLNLEYLWNQVRVQGGAYGCGCNFQRNGGVYFYSYRDPNLKRTYGIYKDLGDEIASFTADEREMTKYILGTINRYDQPKTNAEWIDYAVSLYFSQITEEMRQKERTEILNTSVSDLRQFASLLHDLTNTDNICTIGNEEKIKTDGVLFDSVTNLLK